MKVYPFFACICIALSVLSNRAMAQAVLNADGPGNTYELINSVLAPGHNVVETPECVHAAFGRHIAEVFDTDLNQYVFEFYSHVSPDNDRCINFDRQRTEIKTYDQSPDSLIGTAGELVTYKWLFKIPAGMLASSSFTHIHQVKPVNGDDGNPIFTLTVRKGTPNKLELIHVESETSGSNKLRIVNLSLFEGMWVEATEQMLVGVNGSYSISIKRVSDGVNLLSYTASNILTIRADNSFIRPKWGIYRSLNTPSDLRDEALRFAAISIDEGAVVLPVNISGFRAFAQQGSTVLQWTAEGSGANDQFIIERSADGLMFFACGSVPGNTTHGNAYHFIDEHPLQGDNYYRVLYKDATGREQYSPTLLVPHGRQMPLQVYPNPVASNAKLLLAGNAGEYDYAVFSATGSLLLSGRGNTATIEAALNRELSILQPGLYQLRLHNSAAFYQSRFVKR